MDQHEMGGEVMKVINIPLVRYKDDGEREIIGTANYDHETGVVDGTLRPEIVEKLFPTWLKSISIGFEYLPAAPPPESKNA